MITIIAATNRNSSYSSSFAFSVKNYLMEHGVEGVELLDLQNLHEIPIQNDMFNGANSIHPAMAKLQDQFILPADKFIFIMPEYNGSFPGLLKYFVDAISVRHYSKNFTGKSCFLIGISSGRAGNLRGIDHFTAIMHYLGAHVHPQTLPISKINEVFDQESKAIKDDEILQNFDQSLLKFAKS